jgi:proline iminopeptidase
VLRGSAKQTIWNHRAWAGADTFVLAGGSYGGFLSLGYSLAYPDRLSALILRDTWACGPRGVLRALTNIVTSKRISPDHARQVRLWSGNLTDKLDSQESINEILPIYLPENVEVRPFEGQSDGYESHWEVHNSAFSYSVPRFDVRNRLHEIKAPTLIVVGRYDLICPVEEAEELHVGIVGSQLVLFDASGHNPASDEPKAFQEAIAGFLDARFYP